MFNYTKSSAATLIALLMGVTSVASVLPTTPTVAQSVRQQQKQNSDRRVTIPSGTLIPVRYEDSETIYVKKDEVAPLTLRTAVSIKDRNGYIIIPAGTEIVGQLEPSGQGVRFVADELILGSDTYLPLNATSRVVSKTATIKKGANTSDIITGTLAGAGAATIISGTTGDRRIDPLEVLAGAAVGTLAGWGLPEAGVIGTRKDEVFVINPNRDLTLTVKRNLTIDTYSNSSSNRRRY